MPIPGLGATAVTGVRQAWQATLKKLLEHGNSVVLARPAPQRGTDAPYEIIKERDIAEYIPLGKELTIDGRRMKVDSINYANGKVSLMDMELAEKSRYPVFREEPIAFVREYVEEAEWREFEQTAHVENLEDSATVPERNGEISVGTVLTIDGHRMKIDSVDTARDEVMLLDLDMRGGPPMFSVKSGATVRGLLAEALAADEPASPEGTVLTNDGSPMKTEGSRRLLPDDITFSESIEEVNGVLNFYLDCRFPVDQVFGTHVETDANDDYLNVYANYDSREIAEQFQAAGRIILEPGEELSVE